VPLGLFGALTFHVGNRTSEGTKSQHGRYGFWLWRALLWRALSGFWTAYGCFSIVGVHLLPRFKR
jgi:hypothetical protein